MNKELYVSSTPHETKVALTEDDQLAEVFFERENEYTLAGSIYKGRVTRVLPGMQSAFVDIGLERDAFLYVSDFLELTGDEDEDEEFGSIPAPRGAIDVGKPQPPQEARPAEARNAFVESENEEEAENFTEDPSANGQEQSAAEGEEEGESASAEGGESAEGARRWRGRRRRRGGRRSGRPEERESRPEAVTEAAAPVMEDVPAPPPPPPSRPEFHSEPRHESREPRYESRESRYESRSRHESPRESRSDFGPPAGYQPIILPGESISKYRNLAPVAETKAEAEMEAEHAPTAPVDDFAPIAVSESSPEVAQEIADEAAHLDQGFDVTETETTEAVAEVVVEAPPVVEGRPRSKRGWFTSRRKQPTPVEAAPEQLEEKPAEVASTEEHHPEGESASVESSPAILRYEARDNSEAAGDGNIATEEAPAPHAEHPDDVNGNVADTVHDRQPSWMQKEQHAAPEQHFSETNVFTGGHPHEVEVASHEEQQHDHESDESFERQTQMSAPSEAPAGHTLEHEVLDEEEMEFHPVPADLGAMKEADGDEELVLEEETLDAGAGYNDRWIPKIEEVDEDEVVAAEERGENIFGADDEEEDDESEEGDESNGQAELRTATPTAAYQQRQTERPGYDRRPNRDRNDRDRGRRGGGPRRNNMRGRNNNTRNQPLISDLLKEGQEVLIQIAKEPLGKKGARITSHIALPGRFLVYMPTVNHVGVSRKIASDEERQRLKRIVTSERENGIGGFIVRTAAANIKEDDLRADIRFLKHLWAEIKTRAENSKSPALIYHDLNLVERVMRDQVNADFSQVWVDTEDMYERVVRFANRFQPSLVRRIKLYTKDTPLYEQFGIQDEINRSLKSKVWLKSGGHIVINQTEALVAIDVNTGKYVGKTQRLEDTIVKTNVDAIKEIVRQIRLRDLGGIIVIDFIDMDERKNRQKVMMALEEALRNDRAPSKVLQFNDFGLVAITRKRVKQSLERTLGESCPYCTGAGFVKSVPTVCNELYIEMRKMAKVHDKDDITIRVNPEVTKALKANNGKLITELEELTGKSILVKSDAALHQEMFDIH